MWIQDLGRGRDLITGQVMTTEQPIFPKVIAVRLAEIAQDDAGEGTVGVGRAEEDVVGFDVAVQDAGPFGWLLGLVASVTDAVLKVR